MTSSTKFEAFKIQEWADLIHARRRTTSGSVLVLHNFVEKQKDNDVMDDRASDDHHPEVHLYHYISQHPRCPEAVTVDNVGIFSQPSCRVTCLKSHLLLRLRLTSSSSVKRRGHSKLPTTSVRDTPSAPYSHNRSSWHILAATQSSTQPSRPAVLHNRLVPNSSNVSYQCIDHHQRRTSTAG